MAAVAQVNDYSNQVNDYIVNDSIGKEKKAVGGTYQCESCGADYTAKTVWQKFCPTCSKERKRQVLQAKARRAV